MVSGQSLLARGLLGQDRVRAFIENALTGERLGHAYLFLGTAGSGKLDAAYALAQGALCPQGGCGSCDDCVRVARKTHPDVHLLQPESAQGYLVGQIRELIDDLALAPIRSSRKVYIVEDADQLTSSTANALLKSLEEPPEGVTFVLLAPTRDAVLPTILSRCQVVPFKSVSANALCAMLSDELDMPESLCRRAVGCCASPAQARELIGSPARQEARRAALDCLDRLPNADELDVLQSAKAAVLASKAPLADFKTAQQAVLDENAKVLSGPAMRELEDRQKRELSARERSGIMEQLGAMKSLLRDALAVAAGVAQEPFCDDYARAASLYAARLGIDGVARALACLDRAVDDVRRNVSPQLVYETMLFELKEMIACRS